MIIDTHGHFDHVDANQPLKAATGAQIAIHEADARMLDAPSAEAMFFTGNRLRLSQADILLKEDDILTFGPYRLKVLHTPGHTPGGISLVMEGHPYVYVGDLLFAGSIGRTDFPGGSFDDLINAVRTKIFPLGDNYTVYPGHGPVTTVGQERSIIRFFEGWGKGAEGHLPPQRPPTKPTEEALRKSIFPRCSLLPPGPFLQERVLLMIYSGKRILLGVTGGIAAYKAAELARRFIGCRGRGQGGDDPAAQEFVGPLTFAALTGEQVATGHVRPGGRAPGARGPGAGGGRHRGGPGHRQFHRQGGGGDR